MYSKLVILISNGLCIKCNTVWLLLLLHWFIFSWLQILHYWSKFMIKCGSPSVFWIQNDLAIMGNFNTGLYNYVWIAFLFNYIYAGLCVFLNFFQTPSVQFSNSELINGLIEHIQKTVNVAHQPFEVDRIGLISRYIFS